MGEIQGFVTRTRGRANQAILGVTSGVNQFSRTQVSATKADGTLIGQFPTIREAQRAVELSAGGNFLKWRRQNLRLDIEHWRGESQSFYPGDLGQLLQGGAWFRANQGLRLAPLAPPPSVTKKLARWNSFDGDGIFATVAAGSVVYADAEVITTAAGQPAMQLSAGDLIVTTLAAGGPGGQASRPWSAYAAVTFQDPGGVNDYIVLTIGAISNFTLRVSNGLNIEVVSDTATLVGPPIVDGQTFVVGAIQHATGTDVYVDGDLVGTLAGTTPVDGDLNLSSVSDAFNGDLYEVLLVNTDVNPNLNDKIFRYYIERYLDD